MAVSVAHELALVHHLDSAAERAHRTAPSATFPSAQHKAPDSESVGLFPPSSWLKLQPTGPQLRPRQWSTIGLSLPSVVLVWNGARRKQDRAVVIVRSIVARHLDRVSVHSAPNALAVFQNMLNAPTEICPAKGVSNVF